MNGGRHPSRFDVVKRLDIYVWFLETRKVGCSDLSEGALGSLHSMDLQDEPLEGGGGGHLNLHVVVDSRLVRLGRFAANL